MSPHSPGVGNQSQDVAEYTANPTEIMIAVPAILSKVLICIFLSGWVTGYMFLFWFRAFDINFGNLIIVKKQIDKIICSVRTRVISVATNFPII